MYLLQTKFILSEPNLEFAELKLTELTYFI